MKPQRLTWLLGITGILLIIRIIGPNPREHASVADALVVPAVRSGTRLQDRTSGPSPVPFPAQNASQPSARASSSPTAVADAAQGNAFAVRMPPVPLALPPPARAVIAAPLPRPIAPPPPQPPAPEVPVFSVIGTWNDGRTPGVFVATPVGVRLVKKDGVLLAQYRVTALSDRLIALQDLATMREFQLVIPQGAPLPSSSIESQGAPR